MTEQQAFQALLPGFTQEHESFELEIPINEAVELLNNSLAPSQDLITSIQMHGQLTNIIIAELDSGNYMLIAGNRRIQACNYLGLPSVRATIHKGLKARQVKFARSAENNQRQENPLADIAAVKEAIKVILDHRAVNNLETHSPSGEPYVDDPEIATITGIHAQRVKQLRRMMDLPKPILDAVKGDDTGKISENTAATLANMSSAYQKQAIEVMKQRKQENKAKKNDGKTFRKVLFSANDLKDLQRIRVDETVTQAAPSMINLSATFKPVSQVVKQEIWGYIVVDEDLRMVLAGPYDSKEEAEEILAQAKETNDANMTIRKVI